MSIIQAIILGIVQGLTEFLPVSSSGHLVLLQRLFGITTDNMFFTVMLHVGSLIAVLAVFYKDIWEILKHPFGETGKAIIIATLITGVMYIILGKIIDDSYDGKYLAIGFLYTALLLYVVTKFRNKKRGQSIGLGQSCFIGFMQGIAMFPGVSRSGSTIAGGLLTGIDKDKIARFSFILSIPAILAGAAKEATEISFSNIPWLAVIIGVVCAAISGYFAIRFMLAIIKRQKLSYFSVYLVILSVLILADQIFFHVVFK